jgi:hypothetical protein
LGSSHLNPEGERKFRCKGCGKWIRVPRQCDDFVHKDCNTEWIISGGDRQVVFKHDLLKPGQPLITGARIEPPDSPPRRNKTLDREKRGDSYNYLGD